MPRAAPSRTTGLTPTPGYDPGVSAIRRALSFLLAVGTATSLAGCALIPAPLPTLIPDAGAAAVTASTVDPLSIPGARTMTLAGSPASARVATSLIYLDGAENLNNALDASVLDQLDAYLGARGPYAAQLPPSGLALTSDALPSRGLTIATDAVLAAGDWIELRARSAVDGVAVRQWSLFADTQTGEVHSPADLVADPAGLAAAAGTSQDSVSTLGFAADGSVTLASGVGEQTATLDYARARDLLTQTGRAVQDAAASGAAFRAPGVVPFVHVPCALVACVALTYDDGPSPTTTPALLDVLAQERVPATFFAVGSHVAAHPDIVARERAEGNAVENHSWSHPNLATLSGPEVATELGRTDAAIAAAGGATPQLIRAPFGSAGGAVPQTATHPLVYWSVDAFDWWDRDSTVFVPRVLRKIQPGGIVLMHDIYASTVAGQKRLIGALRGQGYTFVTVPQLFSGVELAAGQQYTCRGRGVSDSGPACTGR